MRAVPIVLLLAACSEAGTGARAEVVITALAEDNYVWARREPELVALKLRKMQRGPFEWLRGTAGLFWRDVMAVGTDRPATAFGDPASSRVLLDGDPHPENLGTFHAADGTMVVDWNDFDGAGYGPFEGDLRRLAAGLIIAAGDDALAAELARQAALGYAAQVAELAAGKPVIPVVVGAEPYLDTMLAKALKKGDAHATLDEIAPVAGGVRQVAFGDIDPVGVDGVIEKRLVPVGAEAADAIDRAVVAWRTTALVPLSPAAATIKLRARRIGAGVSSYAAWRFYVVLEGATASPDDDLVVELKEERDGLIVRGVPELQASEWSSPAWRVVDAQRRLHARADADVLLGAGDVTPLALRVHAEEAYQRGVNATDLAALAADPATRDQVGKLAHRFGAMLARGHGQALTADGVAGFTVIAPLVGDGRAFADEVAALAVADAAQIVADWQSLKDRDLGVLVLPKEAE